MDRLFRNAIELLGGPADAALLAAVQMTSTTPARALGLDRVGSLQTGYRADLVMLDADLGIAAVLAGGQWQPL